MFFLDHRFGFGRLGLKILAQAVHPNIWDTRELCGEHIGGDIYNPQPRHINRSLARTRTIYQPLDCTRERETLCG